MTLLGVDRRVAYLAALLLHEKSMHHYDTSARRLHDPRPLCFGCRVWQLAAPDERAEAERLLAEPEP